MTEAKKVPEAPVVVPATPAEPKAFKDLNDEEYTQYLQGRDMKAGLEIMDGLGYKNTPLGQATDVTPIDDFREKGIACQFEHCISNMPAIPRELGAFHQGYLTLTCPSFGRACPGGTVQVLNCFGKPVEKQEPEKPKANRQTRRKSAKAKK